MKNFLKLKEKVAYGFGDLASVLYWQTFMLYLTYFYTDVFLLPAGVAATMFLVSRVLDGVNDPMMGIIADRTNTKWGKFRPYLLWFAVPFAVVGVLTFTVPDFGYTGKVVWAYTTFILIMVLYTIVNIPYTSLLGVISPNSDERTSVSSIKFIFAFAAGIIVSATLLPMVDVLGNGNEAAGWQRSFMVYGVLAIIFFFIAFKGTKERVQPPKEQKTSVSKDLKELVTNKPWLILLATTITFILFVAVRGSVTVHYFKYFVGEQSINLPFFGEKEYSFIALSSAYNTIGQLSSLLGVFLVGILAKKYGKKRIFNIFFVVAIFSTSIVFLLNPSQIGWIFFFQITGSFTGGPLSVLLWAMYADIADYAELKNGTRATGLIFSASTMSQKFGWAIGGFVALSLMSSVGFQPNEVQTSESTKGLLLLFTVIPAAIGVVSIIIMMFYPLNDRKVKEIGEELAERRVLAGETVGE